MTIYSSSNFNGSTAGDSNKINLAEMQKTMRKLSAAYAKLPTCLVMPFQSWDKIKREAERDSRSHTLSMAPVDHFWGSPVECYDTVRECLDRMVDTVRGGRTKLVLLEDVPRDCVSHPYFRQLFAEHRVSTELMEPSSLSDSVSRSMLSDEQ